MSKELEDFNSIFEDKDLDSLINALHENSTSSSDVKFSELGPRKDSVANLSPAQEALWFLYSLNPLSSAYTIFSAFKLTGYLDIDRLSKAVDFVVHAHEALRMKFFSDASGAVFQQPIEITGPILRVEECENSEVVIKEKLKEHSNYHFDLLNSIPVSFKLFNLGNNQFIFSIAIHHIVIDAFSIDIVIKDIGRAYQQDFSIKNKIQFADYVVWKSKIHTTQDLDKSIVRATKRLANFEPLNFPTDFPRQRKLNHDGDLCSIIIEKPLADNIRDLARKQDASPFMIFAAAYASALSQFSRQYEFILGTSFLDRDHEKLNDVVGFFINMLAIKCNLTGNLSFHDLIARMRTETLNAIDDAAVPFSEVVKALNVETTDNRHPVFQTAISLFPQEHDKSSHPFSTLSVEQVAEQTATRFEIEVLLRTVDDTFVGTLIWNRDLFSAQTMQSLAQTFQSILVQGCENPKIPIGLLNTGAPLPFKNTERLAFPSFRLEDRIQKIVELHESSIAVQFLSEQITYLELWEWSTGIAKRLINSGVKEGDRVGLSVKRSIPLIASMLGILRTGAAYVPLDPDYPTDRLINMLEDGQIQVCLGSFSEDNLVSDQSIIFLDPLEIAPEKNGSIVPVIQTSAQESVAYVLFTSGSTGRPKGVCVTHHNVARLFTSTNNWFRFEQNDVWSMFHSYAFDFSVWEIFGALLHGARLVIIPEKQARDPESFIDTLYEHGVTMLSQTPSAFKQLSVAYFDVHNPPILRLRHIVFGGESLDVSSLKPWLDYFGDQEPQLTNMYGITETTVHVTYRPIRIKDLAENYYSPIGIPLPDLSIRLVNDYFNDVPKGAVGEILVGGDGVTKGYFGQPELTNSRFIKAEQDSQDRWYRSGDLARINYRNELIYLGRSDHQVKVRGFRIELGDIQAAFTSHPHVAAAEVILKNTTEDQKLIAYVVPKNLASDEIEQEQLLSWRETFSTTYSAANCNLDHPDFIGWNSSYDNNPIDTKDMHLWLNETLDRIKELRPNKVLEIGCGTGMILGGVGGGISEYIGFDIAEEVIESLKIEVARKNWKHVKLYAGDSIYVLKQLMEQEELHGNFDLIIINSVIQYFPSQAYLEEVLDLASNFLCLKGKIFLGDLRANTTLDLHHFSLAMRDPSLNQAPLAALLKRALFTKERETELLLDPGVVCNMLPSRNPSIWPRLKEFNSDNEISRFRYDIVIQLDNHQIDDYLDVIVINELQYELHEIEKILLLNPNHDVVINSFFNSRTYLEQITWFNSQIPIDLQQQPIEFSELAFLGKRLNRSMVHYWLDSEKISDPILNKITIVFKAIESSPFSSLGTLYSFPMGVNDPLGFSRRLKFVDHLREHVESLIPEHMVPSAIVTLSQFPLSPTGKLDKNLLPDPESQNYDILGLKELKPPRSFLEKLICQIFTDLTGNKPISLDTNFFSIGGHSLLAMKLIAKLKQVTGFKLRLGVLFENPTPEALASELSSQEREQADPIIHGIGSLGQDKIALSYGQKRLWMLDKIDGPSPAYNIPLSMRLVGNLNRDALINALMILITRHQTLRTSIRENDDGDPEGFILPIPERSSYVIITDLTQKSKDQANQIASDMIIKESERPFDLAQDYPLRVQLVSITPSEHILMLTMHHHAGDGVSMGILAKELSELYAAGCKNIPHSLPALKIQYSDWAAWQHKFFEEATLEDNSLITKVERARLRLNGFESQLDLPTDFPRELGRQRRAKSHDFLISKNLVDRLEALAIQVNTTPFSVVMAAFALCLSKISRQQRVVIGSPVAGRSHEDIQSIVGFFVNTLAIPVDIENAVTCKDLLEQVKKSIQECLIDQDLPFERLVEELGVSRSLNYSPVFQAVLSFHTQDMGNLEFQDLVWSQENALIPIAKYDLNLHMGSDDIGGYTAAIIYDADLFNCETIADWAKLFLQILDGISISPERCLASIPLIQKADSDKLLLQAKGNQIEAESEKYSTINSLFEYQCKNFSDQIALIFEGEVLTYSELDGKANQLARYFIQEKIGPGTIVAFLLERSIEMVLTMLATAKVGAAYLPLDLNYPASRLSFMLKDSDSKILVTKGSTLDEIEFNPADTVDSSLKIIDLNDFIFEARLSQYSESKIKDEERLSYISPSDLAYLIYTSGSTGSPKGVSNTQQNVCSLAYRQSFYKSTSGLIFFQLSSIAFDAATFEIWGALLNGGKLIIPPSNPIGLEEISQNIRKHNVNILWLTSMLFSEAIQNAPDLFKTVDNVYVGGEILPPAAAKLFLQKYPDKILWNMYGPTETTTFALYHQVSWSDLESRSIPIGKPIRGYEAYIFDENMQLLPKNVIGELYIGGSGVARGYFKNAHLTAERFVPNPFAVDGARLYKTGDMVCLRSNGAIEFIGRNDNQIKLRGFRIELDEIQNILLEEFKEYFSQVVVISADINDAKVLCAYVVLRANQKMPQIDKIYQSLSERVPEYMIPSAFNVLENLPLNVNGKLDRAALPMPNTNFEISLNEPPSNESEEYFCQLFSELLGGRTVNRNDSFFSVGGHSLLAIRLVSRIHQDKNIDLPLRVIFNYSTPKALAEYLIDEEIINNYSPLLLIKKGSTSTPLFCVHPGGGFGSVYRDLAYSLSQDQTVYALQAKGLEANEEPHSSLIEMAQVYVDAIRKIQVSGPYQILGWSFGGVIAHEMVALLEELGEKVSFLGILDSPASYPKLNRQPDLNEMLGELIFENLHNIEDTSSNKVNTIPVNFEDRLEFARELLITKGLISRETSVSWVERTLLQFSLSHKHLKNHIYRSVKSKIIYFSAADQTNEFLKNWTPHTTGEVEVVDIPASHTLMLNSEFSKLIAQEVDIRLSK